MRHLLGMIAAAAGAAATTYYFDPDMGRRRRAMLRLQLFGRSPGTPAGMRARRDTRAPPPGDAQLRDRVRVRLGQLVSHPGGIEVQVDDGAVRLSGDVLAKELDGLLTQVRDMPGVNRVINALAAHDRPREMVQAQDPRAAAPEEEIEAHPT